MRKRKNQIITYLDDDELELLRKLVKQSGFSQQAYIRSLIKGYVPVNLPPPDYYAMTNELRSIGNNMNQVAQKAHVLNVIDAQRYDDAFALLKQSLVEIVRAVTLPRKIERKRE